MEKQPKDTVGLQPTEPNTLYQEPTNHARRMPMEQNKREQFIIRRIGGTTLQGQSRVQRKRRRDHGG